MKLRDTILMMCSKDSKQRFLAELYQTQIRYAKLKKTLDEQPESYKPLLCQQLETMGRYIDILEKRAEIEGIEWQK